MPPRCRVGTRRSPLAIVQTEEVVSRLRARFPGTAFIVAPMTTTGDRRKDASLSSLGRGAFAKDIESALLEGDIDLAVHSAKDLPHSLPAGLALAGTVPRQDPRDALIDRWGLPLSDLPPGARIGTGSPRRAALLKSLRPDVEIAPIRGNVGTRIDKVGSPGYDGVALAAAGLARLGRLGEAHDIFPPETFVPDAGQGALAVEARSDDHGVLDMLRAVEHRPSSAALEAERAFLHRLGGGCKVPVAAYAKPVHDRELRMWGMAAAPDGSVIFRQDATGLIARPAELGHALAEALRQEAGEMLQS